MGYGQIKIVARILEVLKSERSWAWLRDVCPGRSSVRLDVWRRDFCERIRQIWALGKLASKARRRGCGLLQYQYPTEQCRVQVVFRKIQTVRNPEMCQLENYDKECLESHAIDLHRAGVELSFLCRSVEQFVLGDVSLKDTHRTHEILRHQTPLHRRSTWSAFQFWRALRGRKQQICLTKLSRTEESQAIR